MTHLSIILMNLIVRLGTAEFGTAFTFSAQGDPQNPNPYAACLRRNMDDKRDAVIAHRTLPCGTRVLIHAFRSGRWTVATVGDRGPYGKKRSGHYRGVVDLSPVVNHRLKARGRAQVMLIRLD